MKLRTDGRGHGYSVWRGLVESLLKVAYHGDWPARLWSLFPQSRRFSVRRHRLAIPPGKSETLRIAFLSDLHLGPTTPRELLDGVFDIGRRERPDVLLLGGDYVFLNADHHRLEQLRLLVESVRCDVKLAVMGNHDLWSFDEAIVDALSEAGVRVLVNESTQLPPPWSDVAVMGLDDPWTGQCDAKAAALSLAGESVRVVMCHSPDGLESMTGMPFDIFLCGHTHGGQIATPWGPVVLPHGRMCGQFSSGFKQSRDGLVYVSKGIGGVELPFRTFATPDVLFLELFRSSGSSSLKSDAEIDNLRQRA